MQRRTFVASIGLMPFIGLALPKQNRLILPQDMTMDQLTSIMVEIYRNDDSEMAIPDIILADGRVLSNGQHLAQMVWEYDIRKGEVERPRIYREFPFIASSVSTFRYDWFLSECARNVSSSIPFLKASGFVRDVVNRMPPDKDERSFVEHVPHYHRWMQTARFRLRTALKDRAVA